MGARSVVVGEDVSSDDWTQARLNMLWLIFLIQ